MKFTLQQYLSAPAPERSAAFYRRRLLKAELTSAEYPRALFVVLRSRRRNRHRSPRSWDRRAL